jgi:putative membrane protein
MKFILRWAINTVALYVAIILLPKFILYQGNWVDIIWLALIFGLVNAILRPPFKALSCLLIILTLGLFTLVINTLLFALTGWIGSQWHIGFTLAEPWFWSAFLGSLVTTLISGVLNGILRDNRKHKSRR